MHGCRQMGWSSIIRRTVKTAVIFTLAGNQWARADEKKPPLSIYEIKPVRDGAILGAATFLDIYPALNGYHFIYIKPQVDPEEVIPFDRHNIGNKNVWADNISDATLALSVSAPVLVEFLDLGWNPVLFEDMMVYAQTMTINSAITALFKYTTQRPIPRVYAGDPEVTNSARGYEEFYSGHVSSTTAALSAFALTLNLRHDAGIWPWAMMVIVSGTVAAERVAAGEHFYTGAIVGGLMGPAVGTLVPYLHKRIMQDGPDISLAPVSDGAQLTWTRHF
jgi:membrane-associated phospholipid phosphatase